MMKAQRNRMNKRVRLSPLLLLLVASLACSSNTQTTNAPANSANAPSASNANAATGANATSNANAATGAQKSPLADIVRASAENVEMRAGETAEGTLRLSIARGYHVNANPATEKFLIPTSLEVKPNEGITAEKITYPKALKKKFAFSEAPLAVYEDNARIAFTIRAPREAAPGQHTLAARLRVQPCDDEKCYPPTNVETSIPITIR